MSTSETWPQALERLATLPRDAGDVTLAEDLRLLMDAGPDANEEIRRAAYDTKVREVGASVYLRGLVEISNVCVKDCFYCGIRKSNYAVRRYTMTREDVIDAALFADERNMGGLVLQSGERQDYHFAGMIEELVHEIRERTTNRLTITLSLGEQTYETYRRWFFAGAHRYLLRIEASNPSLYLRLHPVGHDQQARLSSLRALRDIGYQVGSGVLIGVPGQTTRHRVDDLLFFRAFDLDMIGMGPYVVHGATPLASHAPNDPTTKMHRFELALRMIALTRLLLRDVNIVAATAMQALHPQGREIALLHGANVMMPVVTGKEYRKDYLLYDDRPCVEETATQCHSCLDARVTAIGESIRYGAPGDPPHALRRHS